MFQFTITNHIFLKPHTPTLKLNKLLFRPAVNLKPLTQHLIKLKTLKTKQPKKHIKKRNKASAQHSREEYQDKPTKE